MDIPQHDQQDLSAANRRSERLEVKQVEPGLGTVAIDHPALLLGNQKSQRKMVMEYLSHENLMKIQKMTPKNMLVKMLINNGKYICTYHYVH